VQTILIYLGGLSIDQVGFQEPKQDQFGRQDEQAIP